MTNPSDQTPADKANDVSDSGEDNGSKLAAESNGSTATAVEPHAESADPSNKGLDELLPGFLNPPEEELPDEVEMSLFDHLEELRLRIFYSVIGSLVGIIGCFFAVKPIVRLLEKPAGDVTFLQLAPGEFFFVSIKVAGYSGLLLSAPWILYQVIQFVLPGLTKKERRMLGPIVLGSAVLFGLGLVFSYVALVPAALNFFISYGADVVAQQWSIEKYFDFELLLMFSTAIAFQIPILQLLLGIFGLVNAKQMLAGWRYVLLGAVVLGAVLTPSTDPMTQSLLGGAVMGLYLGGSGLVALVTGEISLGQLIPSAK